MKSQRSRETILVVDDDEPLRNLVMGALRMQGYRILAAANGIEALQVAERQPGRIDGLVTDVDMPHLLGTEVARRLIAARSRLKVLIMSGRAGDHSDDLKCVTSGTSLLQKPFTVEELIRKLRELLDGKLLPELKGG